MPTVELGVDAFMRLILSFFGEISQDANGRDDDILIEPRGQFDLLAHEEDWKSGSSIGVGVGRTVLNELMNKVFSDENIWIRLSDGSAIATSPVGVIPDEALLQRLRAYGYACKFYIISQKCLPPHMSGLFAYAILCQDGDVEALEDDRLLRLMAPQATKLLDKWPTKPADFLEKKDDATLQTLTIQYFEKQPSTLASWTLPRLESNTAYLRRKLFFGHAHRFSQSTEIRAFAEGMDGRPVSQLVSLDLMVVIRHRLGASHKTLLSKMSANRVTSAEEVLARIDWISSRKPELAEDERLYKQLFTRYLRGSGIVRHPRVPESSLTEAELSIPDDHPYIRALMFLMSATGTQQLPADEGTIDMHFVDRYDDNSPSLAGSPEHNPIHWPDHSCYEGLDLPLFGMSSILRQDVPQDTQAVLDFDLVMYISFRPATVTMEFGGLTGRLLHYELFQEQRKGMQSVEYKVHSICHSSEAIMHDLCM
ncbi:hypothetical protein GGX14DRAFT_391588 [Mycena pura]|uniref:Uncharacterized protein n=1 Tax=Mycena pura TaxID=153505 RepID=A0AAD6VLP5_9AGAR|nr:hypothetical protein GGX14DRAFT_391588 [Mycena pura]